MFKMTTDRLIMVIDKISDLTGPISMPNRSKSECELESLLGRYDLAIGILPNLSRIRSFAI